MHARPHLHHEFHFLGRGHEFVLGHRKTDVPAGLLLIFGALDLLVHLQLEARVRQLAKDDLHLINRALIVGDLLVAVAVKRGLGVRRQHRVVVDHEQEARGRVHPIELLAE